VIVKVQLLGATGHAHRRMLIACEGNRPFRPFEEDASAEILAMMDGRSKVFVHAELDRGRLLLGKPAPEQGW
jgi:hypothetical protein